MKKILMIMSIFAFLISLNINKVNAASSKLVNPITVKGKQSWSTKYDTAIRTTNITEATKAQGAVTYKIKSQKDSAGKTVTYYSLKGITLSQKAKTPNGVYTIVITATAAGNDLYKSGSKNITLTVNVDKANNPIKVESAQKYSVKYNTKDSNISFKLATDNKGEVTYKFVKRKNSKGQNVTYFGLSGKTLVIKAKTPVDTYTVVVRATAAGTTNYKSGSKDITLTITVNKKSNPITVTANQTWTTEYATVSKSLAFKEPTKAEGKITYKIVSQTNSSGKAVTNFSLSGKNVIKKAKTAIGKYKVTVRATAAGNSNYNSGYKDIVITVNVQKITNPMTVVEKLKWNLDYTYSAKTYKITGVSKAEGKVTYKISSQKNSSGKTVTNFSLSSMTITKKTNTPAGTYTVVVKATAAGNTYYKERSKNITVTVVINKKDNPITVTSNQTWSFDYSTSEKTKKITGASNAVGSVTYKVDSQPSGSYFSISGTTLKAKAKTPAGSYKVVIKATAAGSATYKQDSKSITVNVTIKNVVTPTPKPTATPKPTPICCYNSSNYQYKWETSGKCSANYKKYDIEKDKCVNACYCKGVSCNIYAEWDWGEGWYLVYDKKGNIVRDSSKCKPPYDATTDSSKLSGWNIVNRYDSQTLRYKVLHYSGKPNNYYVLIHVVNAHDQINSAFHGAANRFDILMTNEVKRFGYQKKGLIAINGSFMNSSSLPNTTVSMSHGAIYNNVGGNYINLGISKDNELVITSARNANELIEHMKKNEIRNAWAVNYCNMTGKASGDNKDADWRTTIGQIDKYNFVVSVGFDKISVAQQNLIDWFGVKKVCNMDGGGSSRLFYNNYNSKGFTITQIAVGRDPSRPIADALYFVER